MGDVIEIAGLQKSYRGLRRRVVAVDGLDLAVPEGGVFGFLGPNGAGKTTTIRCLLGLIRPTRGHVRLLDVDPRRRLHRVAARVGSIVETPALFPGFSGRRNLQLLGSTQGFGRRRVDEVLARVGLDDRADDLVKGYSLGMRQRLGLAAALLGDPELLILDEPANGLDPAGIVEIRGLIRSLGDEGRTVFLSSHLLGEVEQVCDRVAIVARGTCVTSGPVRDVLRSGRAGGLVVKVKDPARAVEVLGDSGVQAVVDGDVLRVVHPPDDAAAVTRILARQRLYVAEMRPDEADLETVFLELTGSATAATDAELGVER